MTEKQRQWRSEVIATGIFALTVAIWPPFVEYIDTWSIALVAAFIVLWAFNAAALVLDLP